MCTDAADFAFFYQGRRFLCQLQATERASKHACTATDAFLRGYYVLRQGFFEAYFVKTHGNHLGRTNPWLSLKLLGNECKDWSDDNF
jgi:hypothetical protein